MIDETIPDWAHGLKVVKPEPKQTSQPFVLPVIDDPGEEPSDNFEPLIIDDIPFPRVASRRIRAMSVEARAEWEAARFKCKTDQLYLSDVLGLDLVENPHRVLFNTFLKKRPGVPMAELDPVVKRRMTLWPRGHAKTVCNRVETVQIILNYPNARLCFLTGGDHLAKLQLAALKQVFEKPKPKFLELFPEFCLTSHQNKKTHEWTDTLDELGTQHEFTVPCRTSTVFAEPTFTISTAKKVKAGGHFDFFFVDDLVHENNYRNTKALEKCYEDFLSLIPLLEPTGYLAMTGTRYSFGDTYGMIIEQAKLAGEASLWRFSIRDCWNVGNCKNCGHPDVYHNRAVNILQPPCGLAIACECPGFESDGVRGVLFPQVRTRDGRMFGFTLEILGNIKKDIGPALFANQYENNPLAADTQTFTETMIGAQTIFDIKQIPDYCAASMTFVVGDLADSETEERDLSVLYVCRKSQGRLFAFDCRFGRWGSSELVDNIIRVLLDPACRPSIVFLEKTLGSVHLNDLITARATQLGLPKVPIQWIKTGNQKGAKNLRIGNIQEALKSKRLFLFAGMPGYAELVQQLVKWPRIKHDDFCDCLGRVVEAPTGYEQEAPPQSSVPSWLNKFHGCDPVDPNYPDSGGGSGLCCGPA